MQSTSASRHSMTATIASDTLTSCHWRKCPMGTSDWWRCSRCSARAFCRCSKSISSRTGRRSDSSWPITRRQRRRSLSLRAKIMRMIWLACSVATMAWTATPPSAVSRCRRLRFQIRMLTSASTRHCRFDRRILVSSITIYEFDALTAETSGSASADGLHAVSARVYEWLEGQCLRASEEREATWLRLTQRRGRRVVQVTSFVGVIRAPDGFQIEVLPKVGKAIGGGAVEARQLLIQMLCCLQAFRHVQTDSAMISAAHMPLLEVFIAEFLRTVGHIVKRGLRSSYSCRQDNLFALRGKLMMASHLRQNLC